MNCPQGYIMSTDGVCQPNNGYARGGMINNIDSTMEHWYDGCNNCMDACYAQGAHCGGCTSYNQGPPCTCILQSLPEPPYFHYCCGYNGSHCGNQCSSACAGMGRGYTGQSGAHMGGQGTGGRRMGGKIRRRRR